MAFDFRSMDKKKLGVIGAAILAGLIAMVLTNSHINTRVEEEAGKRGGLGGAELKKLQQQMDALNKENQNIKAALQQTAAQAQAAQSQQKQQPAKTQPSLALNTPSAHRAVTVMIDSLSAVGGMVSPGDFVDILAHLAVPSDPSDPRKTETTTVTLFQNVQVLAVGSNLTPGTAGYEAQQKAPNLPITLALNPQEASLMSFVQQHGKLQLVLRPPLDAQAYILPAANWESLSEYISTTQGANLVTGKKEETKDVAVEEAPQIEIFRGGSK